ncbi:MAG TPA: hypothetical protein VJC10_00365 [Patescibacteria group bacterium]|nr:hypothetical protein [Patescibacteria group bacterium]
MKGCEKDWKNLLISCVLLFVLFSLNTILVQGFTTVKPYEDHCFADGSFKFNIKNDKPDPLYTKDITLQLVNRKTRNITVPNGIWTKSVIFFNESDLEAGPDEQRSTFISDPAQIQERGDYHVFLSYEGCRQEPCRVNFDLENCPGVVEECAEDPIRIVACASNPRSQLARIRFTGVKNPFLFKNERVGKTVKYYINSSKRIILENGSLPGESFEQVDKNTYEVSFPLLKDETVYDAAVVHRNCDSYYKRSQRVSCLFNELPAYYPEYPAQDTPPTQQIQTDEEDELVQAGIVASPELQEQETTLLPDTGEETLDVIRENLKQQTWEPAPAPSVKTIGADAGLPEITGNLVQELEVERGAGQGLQEGKEDQGEGMATYLKVIIGVVVVGILIGAYFLFFRKKEEPPQVEAFDKSFGFGK